MGYPANYNSSHRLDDVVAVIRRFRHLVDDEGFSLAELLVSLALLGVVLSVAYAMADVVRAGQRVADRDAQMARAITYPMTRMSEILLQNTRIEVSPAPTGYTLSVRTDQNLDNQQEQHNFYLVTAGGDTYIEQSSFLLTAAGDRILPARYIHQLGTRITNMTDGTPLFRYYDASGVEITSMDRVPNDTRSVRITISATVDGRRVTESVMVTFRNRQD